MDATPEDHLTLMVCTGGGSAGPAPTGWCHQGGTLSELIDTTEMYLRTIYELEEEGTPPLRARIAERLSQSGPTVSQTVARMQRDGLLSLQQDRSIELSDTGRSLAARVMRKHRLAECMLADLLQLDASQIHAEACRWEHVMSEDVERRLLDVLSHPTTSPFGNPIPALDELDDTPVTVAVPPDTTTLARAAADQIRYVTVQRIDETAQSFAGAMGEFRRVGVHAGATVKCRSRDERILVGSAGEYAEVDIEVARHILVAPTGPPKGAADAD